MTDDKPATNLSSAIRQQSQIGPPCRRAQKIAWPLWTRGKFGLGSPVHPSATRIAVGTLAGYAGHREAVAAAQVAAKANERAAELEKEAALAKLELQRLKTPRTLGPDRQQFVASAIRPFAGQRYRAAVSQGADDGVAFWESVHAALEQAGWVYVPSGPPSVGDPPAGIPDAALPGIEIRFDPSKENELARPALALGNALHEDGTIVAVNRAKPGTMGEEYKDTLLFVIGARLPPEK